MPNEIIVRVKVIEDESNKIIREKIKVDAANLGDTIAVNVNEHVTQRLEREARADSGGSGGYSRAGDAIGDTIGKRVSDRITERIKVDVDEKLRDHVDVSSRDHISVSDRNREHVRVSVDVDKKSLMQQITGFGSGIADKVSGFLHDGLMSGLTMVFGGDIFSALIRTFLFTLVTTVIAPMLGMALAASVLAALGGGVLAAGIVAAFQDPKIKAAAAGLKNDLAPVMKDFGDNFKGPVLDFIDGLKGVIKQVSPMIDKLGQDFKPVADAVGQGLIGFLQNALPGILRAADDSGPVIQTIAENLPGIGDAIGSLFDHIRKHGPEASQFFDDLFHAIQVVIRALGWLIDILSSMYTVTRIILTTLTEMFLEWAGATLGAARIAFGWIPGIGPKLDHAASEFARFKGKVIDYLNKIPDNKDIQIRMHLVLTGVVGAAGDAFRQLYGKSAGGVASGIAHAATGGSRNGLTMVGEHGPELADMAPGSRVYSNADSLRMVGQGRSDRPIIINLIMDGKQVARATIDPMREIVRNSFGGSVQMAYGS